MITDMPKVYRLDEVAELLKVTRRTMYNYIKSGKVEVVKIGKNWFISEKHLESLLEGKVGESKTYLEMLQENKHI